MPPPPPPPSPLPHEQSQQQQQQTNNDDALQRSSVSPNETRNIAHNQPAQCATSLVSPATTTPTTWTRDKKVLYTVNNSPLAPTKRTATDLQHRATNEPHHKLTHYNEHRRRRESNNDAVSQQQRLDNTSDTSTNNNIITNNNSANNALPASSAGGATTASSTIIGHYDLKKTLGKGNFSTVKLAQHRITHHSVAIKVVKTSILSEDNLMKINREIDVLKKIVTEYCANGELYDYLVDKGKLGEPQSCNYFLQILSAIEYLHDRNVVHRDLKAENLLLTNDFKTIKIADFGFANYYKHDKLLSTWCGSPPYAAPELFKGLHYVGPPVDIWSLGVILYVLVCGSLPFDGHNLVYLKSRVLSGKFRIPFFMSTECESLIRGMLRLDPERRYSIRQIRSHCWTVKHGGDKKETQSTGAGQTSLFTDHQTTINPRLLPSISTASNSVSIKSLDKNASQSNRGQSLDLEDDKKRVPTALNTEDASMLCLNNGDEEKSIGSPLERREPGVKPSRIKNLVDNEIVNAVSNMSLDSNNSSMSMSQSIDTSNLSGITVSNTTSRASTRPDTGGSLVRNLSKENSVDDQIIEFMVDTLRVAESQKVIRDSIANDKYDDLHAIYRLIKDQPKLIFDDLAAAKFKIPSLPLISLNKQQSIKKPSITTGFFNSTAAPTTATTSFAPSPPPPSDNIPAKGATKELGSPHTESGPLNGDDEMAQSQAGAINLVTRAEPKAPNLRELQRRYEDQSWKHPPQLFLTPPSENQFFQTYNQVSMIQQETKGEFDLVDGGSPTLPEVVNDAGMKSNFGRHSFDSTMQQLDESPGKPDFSGNTLTLASTDKHWDSSILDTLGFSSSPLHKNPTPTAQIEGNPPGTACGNDGGNLDSANIQMMQNLAGITTNLPMIGAQSSVQNTIDPNILLAQLNSLASSAAITQSGMLIPYESADQRLSIKFNQSNLMNQNSNAINSLAMQNTLNNPCIPNLSLLDPNGLISGLERRASDGQASYSSLTTTSVTNESLASEQGASNAQASTTTTPATSNMAPAFMSSSSNQLSSGFHMHPINHCPFIPNTTHLSAQHDTLNQNSSENSMIVSPCERQQYDQNVMATDEENGGLNHQTLPSQSNPLDLTKGPPRDGRQQELAFGSTAENNLSSFDQQFGRPSSQRSHSTTSATVVFHNFPTSATTSPRNSLLVSSATNNNVQIPFGTVSPSTLSLSGGGPGHLLNRRKRHSLENESRYQHYHQQHPHHHHHHVNNQATSNAYHNANSYMNDSNRSLRQANQQLLQYPAHSHIGQLRNFAQTFSYKKLMKGQVSPTPWEMTSNYPSSAGTMGNTSPKIISQANCPPGIERNPIG